MRNQSLPKESEANFQLKVIQLARIGGWMVHAERPARTAKGWRTPIQGDPGFPDLVLVRKGKVLFVELKSDNGLTSEAQQNWWRAFLGNGMYQLWRPKDWDEIIKILGVDAF